MVRRLARVLTLAVAASSFPIAALAAPPSTAFNYQGILTASGSNAQGVYDMRISLRNSATGAATGSLVGPVNYFNDVAVTNGQFTVKLDFGNQFNDSSRYLQIEVRKDTGVAAESGNYDPELLPRPQIVAVPLATNSINLNGQPSTYYQVADNLTGTLPTALLSNVPKLNASTNTFVGSLQVNSGGNNAGNMLTSTISGLKFGLASYNASNRPLVNLDGNFNVSPMDPTAKGGAVRVDLRAGYPTIQLLSRPAGGTSEIMALSVEESGNVNITKMNGGYGLNGRASKMKMINGIIKSDGTTTSPGISCVKAGPGGYHINVADFNLANASVIVTPQDADAVNVYRDYEYFLVYTKQFNGTGMGLRDSAFTFIVAQNE